MSDHDSKSNPLHLLYGMVIIVRIEDRIRIGANCWVLGLGLQLGFFYGMVIVRIKVRIKIGAKSWVKG